MASISELPDANHCPRAVAQFANKAIVEGRVLISSWEAVINLHERLALFHQNLLGTTVNMWTVSTQR